jgi:hypothetical protein
MTGRRSGRATQPGEKRVSSKSPIRRFSARVADNRFEGGNVLIPRSSTSPYLLKCGLYGANLIIIAGYTSCGDYPKCGCSQHFNRGTCPNSVTVRKDWIKEQLLDDLQSKILQPDAIGYVRDECGNHVKSAFANLSNELAQIRERKPKLEGELRRMAAGGWRRRRLSLRPFWSRRSINAKSSCAKSPANCSLVARICNRKAGN